MAAEIRKTIRSKAMLPAIKQLIAFRSIHPMDKDRRELAKELIEEIKETYPKEIPPAENTLIRMISENRNKGTDPLDAPWSIASYDHTDLEGTEYQHYQLAAEDYQAIMRVRSMQLRRDDISKSMSIRQALFIARLRAMVAGIDFSKTQEEEKDPAFWLYVYSFQYAIREKVGMLSGEGFNSRELDDALAEGHEKFKEIYRKSMYARWQDFKGLYDSHFLNGTENKNSKDGEQ